GENRQAKLLEVVRTLDPVGSLADFLDGRQEQADQDGDDGNHDEQFNQGEAATGTHGRFLVLRVTNGRENGEAIVSRRGWPASFLRAIGLTICARARKVSNHLLASPIGRWTQAERAAEGSGQDLGAGKTRFDGYLGNCQMRVSEQPLSMVQ